MLLDDYAVPGKNLRVSCAESLDREDLSGKGAASSFANCGNKPKTLKVSLQIPVDDADALTELHNRAIALDDNGDARIYDISLPLAAALKIRKVYFYDNFDVTQQEEGALVFAVSFSLREFQTVPEKRERNLAEGAANSETIEGQTTIGSTDPAKIDASIREATK